MDGKRKIRTDMTDIIRFRLRDKSNAKTRRGDHGWCGQPDSTKLQRLPADDGGQLYGPGRND